MNKPFEEDVLNIFRACSMILNDYSVRKHLKHMLDTCEDKETMVEENLKVIAAMAHLKTLYPAMDHEQMLYELAKVMSNPVTVGRLIDDNT